MSYRFGVIAAYCSNFGHCVFLFCPDDPFLSCACPLGREVRNCRWGCFQVTHLTEDASGEGDSGCKVTWSDLIMSSSLSNLLSQEESSLIICTDSWDGGVVILTDLRDLWVSKVAANLRAFCTVFEQDAQLSQRDRAAGCVIVFAESSRLELGDNNLRTL